MFDKNEKLEITAMIELENSKIEMAKL